MNRPTFGPDQQTLGHPATTRWLAQMDAEEQTATARVDAALHALKIVPQPATKYLIQRKADGFYFAAEDHGLIRDVWVGNQALAYRFDYMAIAELRVLKFQASAALFTVVPVKG